MTFTTSIFLQGLSGQSAQAQFFKGLFEGANPLSWQVVLVGAALMSMVVGVVVWELFRKRREQLAKVRRQWEHFQAQARAQGLGDGDVSLMREMYQRLDALHAPDAMLRIAASYDRALDSWIASRGGKVSAAEWEHLGSIRRRLGFKGMGAETSLSHTRQIAESQEVRLASEDEHFSSVGKVVANQENRLIVGVNDPLVVALGTRIRLAFSRQGDGEYKAVLQVILVDRELNQIHFEHTEALTRQQLRMWVRVPVLIEGKMRRVIGPDGGPHPKQSFDVTLLDLSGGGAMVSSTEPVEVESRGLLDFQLGETRLEGVRFVMLRTGKNSRNGGHVCHLCFESIDIQTQERIMRYVFERQRTGRNVV